MASMGRERWERVWCWVGTQPAGGIHSVPACPQVWFQHPSSACLGFWWARGAAACQPGSCHPTPCAQTNASD